MTSDGKGGSQTDLCPLSKTLDIQVDERRLENVTTFCGCNLDTLWSLCDDFNV